MRPIRFRVWAKKHEEMLFPSVLLLEGGSQGEEAKAEFWQHTVSWTGDKTIELMQFTGLLDKNGKEIYESDIIHIIDWSGATGEHTAEVYWDDAYLCWSAQWLPKQSGADSLRYIKKMLKKTGATPKDDLGNFRWPQLEVIGNVHENPELTK